MTAREVRMTDPADKVARPRGHDQVPGNPKDGDTFTCSCCGYAAEYVDLNAGEPVTTTAGEWVQTSQD